MTPPESLLVMSRDPATLRVLSRALALSGFTVDAARDWTDVASGLGNVSVSMLVADVDEFGCEDLARVHRLRAEFPGVEVIALVAMSTPALRAAEHQGVLRAVLEKPVVLTELEGAVRSVLARTTSP